MNEYAKWTNTLNERIRQMNEYAKWTNTPNEPKGESYSLAENHILNQVNLNFSLYVYDAIWIIII